MSFSRPRSSPGVDAVLDRSFGEHAEDAFADVGEGQKKTPFSVDGLTVYTERGPGVNNG